MIILKHYKEGDVSYVSHKDILRVLQRGLKRAKVDVRYSQGYVPHMLTYTSTPVPLGVQSLAEYFAVDCTGIDEKELLKRYNASMPTGMRAVASFYKDKNPNLAAIVVASDYVATASEPLPQSIEEILKEESIVIRSMKKGEAVQKEIRSLVFDVKVQGNKLFMRLASGNSNLRADDFVAHINAKYGCDIKTNDILRTAQLVSIAGNFVDVEEILK